MSIKRYINKMWCIRRMEYYLAIKSEVLMHVTLITSGGYYSK